MDRSAETVHFKYHEEISEYVENLEVTLGILFERDVLRMVSQHSGECDRETNKRLSDMFKEILERILKHASKEDDKLLPVLRKNRRLFGGM